VSDGGLRVVNESGGGGAFSELLRLQTEFQARLAEETLNYLRRVQGAAAPAAPGTILVPQKDATLTAAGAPGSTIRLRLQIENRQRVHSVVTPMLSPLVSPAGVTWFPAADLSPSSILLAPGQVRTLELGVPLPAELPPETYRGVLLLQGFGEQDVAVAIEARAPAAPRAARRPAASSRSRGGSPRKR
jgi:hypothetical protein